MLFFPDGGTSAAHQETCFLKPSLWITDIQASGQQTKQVALVQHQQGHDSTSHRTVAAGERDLVASAVVE
jgi:hypothetical protein